MGRLAVAGAVVVAAAAVVTVVLLNRGDEEPTATPGTGTAALRAAPAASGPGAVVRCGSAARADAGYRWTRFPIDWRLSRVASPPGVRRPAALAAIRRARGV